MHRNKSSRFFEDTSAGSVRQYSIKQHEQLDTLSKQLREADRSLAAAAQAERDRLADVFKTLALVHGDSARADARL